MSQRFKPKSVFGNYGAPMGRRDKLGSEPETPVKLRLQRLDLVDGDYDQGGAYWGYVQGLPMWVAHNELRGVEIYVRAPDRDAAKRAVFEDLPMARFYR